MVLRFEIKGKHFRHISFCMYICCNIELQIEMKFAMYEVIFLFVTHQLQRS
jgi:hypothetical protein